MSKMIFIGFYLAGLSAWKWLTVGCIQGVKKRVYNPLQNFCNKNKEAVKGFYGKRLNFDCLAQQRNIENQVKHL